jgi:hypothetical protein
MGWRDAIKSLKPGHGEPAGEPQDITAIASDEPEPEWFKPKNSGTYVGGDPDGKFRYLRFLLTGRVYLASGPESAADARPLLGPENPDPTVGQYTPAGRFTVQRRFERPIVCTVLDLDESGLTARVTATGTATSGEYRYTFEPDLS